MVLKPDGRVAGRAGSDRRFTGENLEGQNWEWVQHKIQKVQERRKPHWESHTTGNTRGRS